MILPLLAAAWLLAFAAVAAWEAPWWLTGLAVAALTPLVAWWRGIAPACWCLVAAAVALTGGWRYEAAGPAVTAAPAGIFESSIVAEGVVASEPDPGLRTVTYRVDLDRLDLGRGPGPAEVAVLITVNQYTKLLPGDRLRLAGRVQEPPDDLDGFDYRAFLLGRGVVGRMPFPRLDVLEPGAETDHRRASTRLRLHLEDALQRALPEPEASLGAGIAVGRDDAMPPDLIDDFRISGLAHLTAVSGGNVAILAVLVFAVAVPVLGRTWAPIPAAILIAAYLAAAGFEVTIVRASIMAWIFLVGLWLGRPQSGLAGLAAAAILMTGVSPPVSHEAGFQLSLAATAGLIVLAPWLQAGADRVLIAARLAGTAGSVPSQAFAFTLAATVATLPIVAHTFGRVSLIGLVTNIVALPLFVLAFTLSLATAVASSTWTPAGWAVGLAAYYPLAAIRLVAEVAAAVPGAAVTTSAVGTNAAIAWICAYALAAWPLYRRNAPRRAPVAATPAERLVRRGIFAAGVGGLAMWVGVVSLAPIGGPDELELHVLDVGQGDAILLRTPNGRNVLIDGGPSALAIARQLGEALPHWERRIDLVVLTHPQEDHVAGLARVLGHYEIGTVAGSGRGNPTLAYRLFAERAGSISTLGAGDTIVIDTVRIEVLWPGAASPGGDLNASSVVLRVSYGDAVALLTGDIEQPSQRELLARTPLRAQVLKVPHHGAATSDGAFFEAVGADLAVISVGAENTFGHPAEATLDALGDAAIYRTDLHGRIVLRSDGTRWSISTSR